MLLYTSTIWYGLHGLLGFGQLATCRCISRLEYDGTGYVLSG